MVRVHDMIFARRVETSRAQPEIPFARTCTKDTRLDGVFFISRLFSGCGGNLGEFLKKLIKFWMGKVEKLFERVVSKTSSLGNGCSLRRC
jgi:hypothetical protein